MTLFLDVLLALYLTLTLWTVVVLARFQSVGFEEFCKRPFVRMAPPHFVAFATAMVVLVVSFAWPIILWLGDESVWKLWSKWATKQEIEEALK
jgi:peptidoglycan/LPS O-acetylase OafA/YrhL